MIDNEKVYIDLQKVPLESERNERRQLRRKRILTVLLCLLFFVAGIGTSFIINRLIHPKTEISAGDTLSEIEYLMENYWLYSKDHENLKNELEDKAFYGMTSFDEDIYTGYMSAKEMEEFSSGINMDYVGIGVQYSKNDDLAIVMRVFKDSPAYKAGIMTGDIVKAVDGTLINELSSDEVKELVIGPEGTDVVITVTRDGKDMDLVCTRAAINSSVYAYKENDYVIMELISFGNNTAQECVHYLDEYTDLEKIIIDIRGNTGGYQTSVQEVCGLFIGDNKVYLRQKGVDGKEIMDYTRAIRYYDNFKNIVIVADEDTASAAEVFAICMRESHPNVTIVGTTTYGKGVIQSNRLLSNGGALKYTAYHWYSPNGNSIDKVGVVPDIEVKLHDINYQYYSSMDESVTYELDSVSEYVRLAQLALDYLDYQVDRTDGYFDESTELALSSFKNSIGMDNVTVLDSDTMDALVSAASRQLSMNPEKDTQLMKAKEIINGN